MTAKTHNMTAVTMDNQYIMALRYLTITNTVMEKVVMNSRRTAPPRAITMMMNRHKMELGGSLPETAKCTPVMWNMARPVATMTQPERMLASTNRIDLAVVFSRKRATIIPTFSTTTGMITTIKKKRLNTMKPTVCGLSVDTTKVQLEELMDWLIEWLHILRLVIQMTVVAEKTEF